MEWNYPYSLLSLRGKVFGNRYVNKSVKYQWKPCKMEKTLNNIL